MRTATELRAQREALIVEARKILNEMEDNADPKKLADLEKRHDAAMAELDKLDAELRRFEKTEQQERLSANYRAGLDDSADSARRAAMRPMPGDSDTHGVDYGNEFRGSAWRDDKGAEVRVLARSQPLATERWDGPSLGDCLRAMVVGPRNEAERRALSEGTDSAGGYTVPKPLALIFIDRLRAASVVMRAGATTVDMTSDTLAIARLATDPTMSWRLENAEITASDPTFERVLLDAKSLAGLVKVSRELIEDSINIGAMLENAFIQAAAVEFDRACLYGSGSSGEPTGLALTSGINEVDNTVTYTNGGILGMDTLIDATFEAATDNAPPATAMIWHPRTGKQVAKLKDGQGQYLPLAEPVAAIPNKLVTTSMSIAETAGSSTDSSSVLMGYFPDMFIGLRSQLRIELLKERFGEFLQYGFVAHLRGDMQLAHKLSFTRIKGVRG